MNTQIQAILRNEISGHKLAFINPIMIIKDTKFTNRMPYLKMLTVTLLKCNISTLH